ncbi:MAG: hypothetical protein IKG21_13070 [Atopobiaceae bacterium]|nr:hypothetical protein [Atopobiaceae bacterium]
MRPQVYIPPRIASVETRDAVTVLCDAITRCGAMPYADAEQSLCRLLGWMCQQDAVCELGIEAGK